MFGLRNRIKYLALGGALLALLALACVVGCKKDSTAEDAEKPATGGGRRGRTATTNQTTTPAGGAPTAPATLSAADMAAAQAAMAEKIKAEIAKVDAKQATAEVSALIDEAAKQAGLANEAQAPGQLKQLFSGDMAKLISVGLKMQPESRKTFIDSVVPGLKQSKGGKISDAEMAKARQALDMMRQALGLSGGVSAVKADVHGLPHSDIEKAKKIQKFAALYGPVTWVKERNWDGTIIEWVVFKDKNRTIQFPLAMIMDVRYPDSSLRILKGYFEIYAYSNINQKNVISKQMITAPKGMKEQVIEEEKAAIAAARQAAQAAAKAAAAEASASASTSTGGSRGGARGGPGGGRGGQGGGRGGPGGGRGGRMGG